MGFRPTGGGTTARCPRCGAAWSHGLAGNPNARRVQPCGLVTADYLSGLRLA